MKKLIITTIALSLMLVLTTGCFGSTRMGNARRQIDEMHQEIGALRSELNVVQKDLDEAMEIIAELTLYIENNDNMHYVPSESGSDISETDAETPDGRAFEITLPTRDQVIDGFADSFWYIIDFSNDLSAGIRERQEDRQNPKICLKNLEFIRTLSWQKADWVLQDFIDDMKKKVEELGDL